MNFPFFRLKPDRIDVLAGIRDQIIVLGTHVRFLVADAPVPQPRDEAGRFVSKRAKVRDQLEHYRATTTPEQRKQEADAFFAAKRTERLKMEMGK